ncbi:MAG: NUDIX hydrolase [Ruminococcaceae bacterium]|nr:NUDIX hydrolase [Oscillospiraceae bacterium]
MDRLFEKQLNSTNVYKGRLLDVYSDEIVLPNGHKSKREYIKHVGAACVVPVDDEGNVIIEKQFRYPFSKVLTEIPAGKLDSKAEPHLDAALRELKEETGYSAEKMIYLGEFYPTCAYSDEIIHMYLATGLKKGEQKLDDDEFVGVEKMPLEELVAEIMKGNIPDGKTQTAILKAYYYLKNN